jgi:hypothetical protein
MSVIVISAGGLAPVRRLLAHLHAQTLRRELEIVFVCRRPTEEGSGDSLLSGFAAFRWVTVDRADSTARLRAIGFRAATAPIVAMTEDHCLPEPGWAEALVHAHRESWAAVGPAILNGNPHSLLSWANFAIEYSEWLYPLAGGEVRHIPGHNSSYKRRILLSYGDALGDWLEAESLLHWDLREKGLKVAMEPKARARHFNVSRLLPTVALRFNAGMHYAGMCRDRWSRARRALYIGGCPLIPIVRLARLIRQFKRPGRPSRLLPLLVPVCLVLLTVETLGELSGYTVGPGSSSRRLARIDFHRFELLNRRDRRILSCELTP